MISNNLLRPCAFLHFKSSPKQGLICGRSSIPRAPRYSQSLAAFRNIVSSTASNAFEASPVPRMILADAMALLYRSHYAFSPDHRLRTAQGEDTTVIFGFLSTLLALLELNPPPTHLAVVFDASGKTFRHELFPGYKGHRPETPEEIRNAIPRLQEILQAMGIAELRVPGVEADDVIGTLALRSLDAGMAVAIASPDKDFFQLLRHGLFLLRPPKKSVAAQAVAAGAAKSTKYALRPYTSEDFREEWNGLEPSQFIDILALMGDSSDNVPGVQGIGPKTAMALLLKYGSLDAILHNSENLDVKGRGTKLLNTQEGAAAAQLSRQLVEIRTDLDVPPVLLPIDKFRMQHPADGGLEALRLLRQLELESHSRRIKELWRQWG